MESYLLDFIKKKHFSTHHGPQAPRPPGRRSYAAELPPPGTQASYPAGGTHATETSSPHGAVTSSPRPAHRVETSSPARHAVIGGRRKQGIQLLVIKNKRKVEVSRIVLFSSLWFKGALIRSPTMLWSIRQSKYIFPVWTKKNSRFNKKIHNSTKKNS